MNGYANPMAVNQPATIENFAADEGSPAFSKIIQTPFTNAKKYHAIALLLALPKSSPLLSFNLNSPFERGRNQRPRFCKTPIQWPWYAADFPNSAGTRLTLQPLSQFKKADTAEARDCCLLTLGDKLLPLAGRWPIGDFTSFYRLLDLIPACIALLQKPVSRLTAQPGMPVGHRVGQALPLRFIWPARLGLTPSAWASSLSVRPFSYSV